VLSSTNLIENLFARVREIGGRVKRWQNGTMVRVFWPNLPPAFSAGRWKCNQIRRYSKGTTQDQF
jgi:hypothetical protein